MKLEAFGAHKKTILLATAIAVAFVYSSCGVQNNFKPNQANKGLCRDDDGKLVEIGQKTVGFVQGGFAEAKIQIPEKLIRLHEVRDASGASQYTEIVKSGSELVMIYNQECLKKQSVSERNEKARLNSLSSVAVDHFRKTRLEAKTPRFRAHAVSLDENMNLESLKYLADNDSCIVGLSENALASPMGDFNDSDIGEQEYLHPIGAFDAWDVFFGTQGLGLLGPGEEVIIAFVDTGVQLDHPDIAANLWNDGSGNHGRDVINEDDEPEDDWGHGTHVAGLAAAAMNNSEGIAGIIGSGVRIMPIKVFNTDPVPTDVIINGIYWAVDNGADVMNLSVGQKNENEAYNTAVRHAVSSGVVVVTAAGNYGDEVTAEDFFSPMGYCKDIDGAISVGSTDVEDEFGVPVSGRKSCFSNFSSEYVEISAPGARWTREDCTSEDMEGIYATERGSSYGRMSGTSMSTPIVSGAAALAIGLLRVQGKAFSPADVEDLILNSAEKNGNLISQTKDGNFLDLLSLSFAIHDFAFAVPTPDPTVPNDSYPYCSDL